MTMETILLYSKKPDETGDCEFCNKARAQLDAWGIPFTETKLEKPEREALYDDLGLTGANHRTVPQVMIKDIDGVEQRIGGYTALLHSGLQRLFQ